MHVVSVAYAFAPVRADAVGGAEQVLHAIDRALVAAGHRSTVVACEGSDAAGALCTTFALPARIPEGRQPFFDRVRTAIASVPDADLVHLHGIDCFDVMPPPGLPVLVTLHLPLDWYPALRSARPDTWFSCVSAPQHAGRGAADLLLPIANGVDLDALRPAGGARAGFLVMGRICPEKGQHLALQAAHAGDVQLTLAGGVFPYAAHEAYHAARVAPLLDARRMFVGSVAGERKRALLAGAQALIVPSLVAETSSLVAMEAAACGTPVIAFARGALPETVVDGRTGIIVRDVSAAGLARAMRDVGGIDPAACRAEAVRRFGVRPMTDAYLARYAALL